MLNEDLDQDLNNVIADDTLDADKTYANHGDNMYSYHSGSDTQKEPVRKKKKSGFGMTVLKTICVALIFGLVSSLVMLGVSKATGMNYKEEQPAAMVPNQETHVLGIVQVSSEGVTTTHSEGVPDIVEQVMPSIVAVNTTIESISTDWFGRQYTREGQGAGSGIIISEDDHGLMYLLTNYHVVENAKTVSVQFEDGASVNAEVKGFDKDGDVAVLTVKIDDLEENTKKTVKVAVLGDSDQLRVGESAIAIGNALGYGQSVTTGVISASSRDVALTDKTMTLVQTSAAINPGNSGGALLNGRGEVVGMNTVKFRDTAVEGMGFAIPINTAIDIAKGIIEGTSVAKTDENTAYLGITGGSLSEEIAASYHVPVGVYISSVAPRSAAERAGLKAGCIITGFNGETIKTMEELQAAIAKCVPGESITMTAEFADAQGNYSPRELTTFMGSKAEMEE